MRSRLIIALAVVLLAAGGLTWRLGTATVDLGPLTIGHQGPVTVGACRVPIGPIAVVSAASAKVEEREPGGPVGKAVDYEIGHSETAHTLTVVHGAGRRCRVRGPHRHTF